MPPKPHAKTKRKRRRRTAPSIGPKNSKGFEHAPKYLEHFLDAQELLTALDVEAATISAAHVRVAQQLKKLQFEEQLLQQMLAQSRQRERASGGMDRAAATEPAPDEFVDA